MYMKIDLITIFPGIVFETHRWNGRKEVKDPNTYDEITFNNSYIVSYKKFHSVSKNFEKIHIKHIEEIHKRIIDSKGNQLKDYTIILDKNIDKFLEVPTQDSQQLITYFSYLQDINCYINKEFIKILCNKRGGRSFYINNQHEYFDQKYSFVVTNEPSHGWKIKIHKKGEKVLMDTLSAISNNDTKKYKRLINAISLFNESCRINQFNPNSSIVLMVSAFESLLNIPRGSKKSTFAYAMKMFWGFDEIIEEWAKNLYALRSQIVHGDVVEGEKLMASQDRHYPHFKIAKEIFHDCLLFILESYGYITVITKYKSEVINNLRNKVISNKEKAERILTNKKKYSYKAFLKKKDLYEDFILKLEDLTIGDNSAQSIMINIRNIIFDIAENWIKAEKGKTYKNLNDKQKEYLKYKNKKYDDILIIIDNIKKGKVKPKDIFGQYGNVMELEKEVRKLEPVSHSKDVFNFTIPEFLSRCLSVNIIIY